MSHGLFSKLRAEIWLKYLILHQGMDLEHSPKLGTAQAIPNTNLWLIPAFVCALLFYMSFTSWAGTAWAARVPRLHQSRRDIEWQDNIVAGGWLGSLSCYCVHARATEGARVHSYITMCLLDCARVGVSDFCFSLSRVCVCAWERPYRLSGWIGEYVQLICKACHILQAHTHTQHTQ